MVKHIMAACDRLIITGCGSFKRCNVAELSKLAVEIHRGSRPILSTIANPVKAFRQALVSNVNDIVAVCGSFYLLGAVYKDFLAMTVEK